MRKNKVWLFWSVAIVFLISGCELLLIGGIIGGGAVPGHVHRPGGFQPHPQRRAQLIVVFDQEKV